MESVQQVADRTNRCQCQSGKGFFKRMRQRKVCVKSWSMHSICWRTSRKMVIAQSRVLCEISRKGIMEGLRNVIKVGNYCAMDVGHLKV